MNGGSFVRKPPSREGAKRLITPRNTQIDRYTAIATDRQLTERVRKLMTRAHDIYAQWLQDDTARLAQAKAASDAALATARVRQGIANSSR